LLYSRLITAAFVTLYHAEMIAELKAMVVVSEKLTDSAIAVRIHSDSRQAVKQFMEGPAALQDERIGCKIWENL